MNTSLFQEQKRAQTKQAWQTPLPEPVVEDSEQLAQIMKDVADLLKGIITTSEIVSREQYERTVQRILPSGDATASIYTNKRDGVALELQSWPVAFRAKELDSGFVTSWQDGFNFDPKGVLWTERNIAWGKLEWIELNASDLNGNERKWLEHRISELGADHRWSFPLSQKRCFFYFHSKSWEAEERDGAGCLDD